MEPPARPAGSEHRLTATQLRMGRFIHTWQSGSLRQTWLFSRLDEGLLDSLPWHTWVRLSCESEDGQFFLNLPEHFSDLLPGQDTLSESTGEDLVIGVGEAEVGADPLDASLEKDLEEDLEEEGLLALGEAEPVAPPPPAMIPVDMVVDTWVFDTTMVAGLVEVGEEERVGEGEEDPVAVDDGHPSEEITAVKPPPRLPLLGSMMAPRHVPQGIERATVRHLQQQLQETQERNKFLEARVRELEIRIAQMHLRR